MVRLCSRCQLAHSPEEAVGDEAEAKMEAIQLLEEEGKTGSFAHECEKSEKEK